MEFDELITEIRKSKEGVRSSLPLIADLLKVSTHNDAIRWNESVKSALSDIKRELNNWDMKKERWKN